MRLVDVRTLQLVDFTSSDVPAYAILSHTWGDEEITYQEMVAKTAPLGKGYAKMKKTCELASRRHRLSYAWVDTCCIDKTSSAELTESINSMFTWYGNAAICYVRLEDYQAPQTGPVKLPPCRWFTRGFTLQELLAPKKIDFFDSEWNFIGNKQELCEQLSMRTRIPIPALTDPGNVFLYSIAARMSWAAGRSCRKIEDRAYSLLGLCDVNMPLIYGEGRKAFRRLQEEIVKRNNDLTVFAWHNDPGSSLELLGVFADSPDRFAGCGKIRPFLDDQAEFSVSNKGLVMSGGIESPPLRWTTATTADGSATYKTYVLYLGNIPKGQKDAEDKTPHGGIYLRKIGPTLFCRDSRLPLAGFGRGDLAETRLCAMSTTYYILIDRFTIPSIASIPNLCNEYRHACLTFPPDSATLALWKAAPTDLWDSEDRVFLNPSLYPWQSFPDAQTPAMFLQVLTKHENEDFSIVAVCYYKGGKIHARLIDGEDSTKVGYHAILQGFNGSTYKYWSDYCLQVPDILQYGSTLAVTRGDKVFTISIVFIEQLIEKSSDLSGRSISRIVPRITVESKRKKFLSMMQR